MKLTASNIRRKINSALHALGFNCWHDGIPLGLIGGILGEFGLAMSDGIYCGADGQTHEKIGEACGKEFWINLSWHRMTSGRYEIVAYVS